jgi:hypothetical protein
VICFVDAIVLRQEMEGYLNRKETKRADNIVMPTKIQLFQRYLKSVGIRGGWLGLYVLY